MYHHPTSTSHGNILSFTPPGLNQVLNVKFPDSRLAVCEKCKKNYKTRDMCRVRNSHTEEPWSTAFICITLDMTCTDSTTGKYVDKPFQVRMNPWQPFCVKQPFDAKTPVCAGCKKTNRTRSFCRERHQHRQLPWCTVYVTLTAVDNSIPAGHETPGMAPQHVTVQENKEAPVSTMESINGAPHQETTTSEKAECIIVGNEQTQPVGEIKKELSPVEAVREAFSENKLPTLGTGEEIPNAEQVSSEVMLENGIKGENMPSQEPQQEIKHEVAPNPSTETPTTASPPSTEKIKSSQEGDDILNIDPSRTDRKSVV